MPVQPPPPIKPGNKATSTETENYFFDFKIYKLKMKIFKLEEKIEELEKEKEQL